ncbi:MAG TPA: hypothetical protein VFG99_11050 [Chloroflexia bacterium]|nr:hypothetical protein [Chloroflexia bacterium]
MINQGTITMKWTIVLLAAMMAAIVVLSGPVASVLDLPEPTAEAKKKKKKKKKRPPSVVPAPAPAPELNEVQCVNAFCDGTDGDDRLVGTPEREFAQGKEGNDVYDTKGGPANNERDYLIDISDTSNDTYLIPDNEFGHMAIDDKAGSSDVIDLSSYNFADFDFLKYNDEGQQGQPENDLLINGPGSRLITLIDHFDEGADGGKTIEQFKFKDGVRTADQVLQ